MANLIFEKFCGKIEKYKGKIGDKIGKFEKYVGEIGKFEKYVGEIGKFVKFNGKMGGEMGKQNRKVGGKIRIFENMVANQKN